MSNIIIIESDQVSEVAMFIEHLILNDEDWIKNMKYHINTALSQYEYWLKKTLHMS